MPVDILLIDNDLVYSSLTKEFLDSKAYRVHCVATQAEALVILRSQSIAVVLLDLRLEREDDDYDETGLILAEEISRECPVPIIVITKHRAVDSARAALRLYRGNQALAVDYVAKQDGLPALADAIDRILYRAKVFICYSQPDIELAASLYKELESFGFVPWMSRANLQAGNRWKKAVEKQIRRADCFVLLASQRSINRKGFFNREIRIALEVLDERPEDEIFLLPARLDDCQVPSEIAQLHWVDLYKSDGLQLLAKSIRTSMQIRYAHAD